MSHITQHGERSPNQLLSSLPIDEYIRLNPYLHTVRLLRGDVIGEGRAEQEFAYFPTSCVVSLICDMEEGATAEVAVCGWDGVLGTALYLGGNSCANRAVVGIAGEATRMEGRILREHFMRGGSFQNSLLRYAGALIAQISLTAACNRRHTLEKRLCRWLLLIRDRTVSDELVMTQEFMANMLGGRRETVTVAAGRLQDAGLIDYTRGRLRIINRKGMEETVCPCYQAVRAECCTVVNAGSERYVNVCGKSRVALV